MVGKPGFPLHRITTDQEFVHWVRSQPGSVIGIFVSTGDGHDPLRQQFVQLVIDFARLPLVFQTSRQCFRKSQASVSGFEQDRSPIGATLRLIKLRNYRSIKNIWEQQTLCCGMFGQAKASLLVSNPNRQRICTIAGPFALLNHEFSGLGYFPSKLS